MEQDINRLILSSSLPLIDPNNQTTPRTGTSGTGGAASSVFRIHNGHISTPLPTLPGLAIPIAQQAPLQLLTSTQATQQLSVLTLHALPFEVINHIHTMLDQHSRRVFEHLISPSQPFPLTRKKQLEKDAYLTLTVLFHEAVSGKNNEELATISANCKSFFKYLSKSEIRKFLLEVFSINHTKLQQNFEAIARFDFLLAVNLITALTSEDVEHYKINETFLIGMFQQIDELDNGRESGRALLDGLRQSLQTSALHFVMQPDIEGGEENMQYTFIAQYLINTDRENNINVFDNEGRTLLMYAVDYHNHTIAHLLMDWNVDMNLPDRQGNTALMRAVMSQDTKMVQLLLHHGNDRPFIWRINIDLQNNQGNTALMHAVMERNVNMVKWLLEYGADRALPNKDGKTVLDLAWPNRELMTLLQLSGFTNSLKERAFLELMRAVGEGDYTAIELLRDIEEVINNQNAEGNTALMQAVVKQNVEIVQLLINLGARLDLTNNNQQTARQLAETRGNKKIRALLKE
jgi:ankyrin repeat protein